MFRTLNAEKLNYIANDLEVRPFLGGVGELNLTEVAANIQNFCFLNDEQNGGHLLINKGNGIYEVHTLSLPEARGKRMSKLAREMLAYMFLQTDCGEIQTFVPEGQPQTYLWAQIFGFRENFKRDKCFNLNGVMIGGSYLSLTYQDWVLKDKDNFRVGQEFHYQIEKFDLLTHEDDAIHDAWVGATCRSQTLSKAISYYNQWATRTNYHTVTVVSYVPFVIDFGNAVIQQNADHSFSVLKVNDQCLVEPCLLRVLPQA